MSSAMRRVTSRGLSLGTLAGMTLTALTAVVAVGILAGVSCAQTLDQEELKQPGLAPPDKGDWNVSLGLGIGVEPRFLGAEHYRVMPIPLVSVAYRDVAFLGPQGLGVNLLNWKGLHAGPVLGFAFGRPESRDTHLNGLGDIQPSLEAGGFISYEAGPVKLNGSIRQAATHTDNGLTGRVSLQYLQPLLPKKLVASVGPEFTFANGRYAQTWFGVTGSQSSSSGLPVYSPHGGLRDVGINASLTYHLTEHFLLRPFTDLRRLVGEMSDSPIVQRKTQVLVGFGGAYHF